MEIKDTRQTTINRAQDFVENLTGDIYLIGRNKYGISITTWLTKKDVNVVGYIDDYTTDISFDGLPIFKSNLDFSKAVIINCVVEGRTVSVQNFISSLGPLNSIDYFALQFAFKNELEEVNYISNTDSILDEKSRYQSVYNHLSDETSKVVLEKLLNFRLNRDPSFLNGFTFRPEEQYFEKFISLPQESVFVDGGGYDGLTSILFTKNFPKYSNIYYFEPSEKSMLQSKVNLNDYRNITFFEKGLWNKTETLKFNNSLGNANRISNSGEITIHATALDEVIFERVDFIKMDIEGAELNALYGSKNLIAKYSPILAICVYHKQIDFIQIPEFILSINPDYKIFIRHYTEGVC
jgi:FkbM family methyltransferase